MSQIDLQSQYYDSRWANFEFANRLKLQRAAAILNALASTKIYHPKIVDLGCGAGWLTSIVGNFGPALGVDLSPTATREASEKYPYVEFLAVDLFNWDHPMKEFDVVVSQEVIEHVEDQAAYLKIAHALLKDNGYLVLTTPNRRTFNALSDEQRNSWTDQPLENWLDSRELKKLLEVDFQVKAMTTIIPGYGTKGVFRFVNSIKIRNLLNQFHWLHSYHHLLLSLGFGLHLLAIAQRKSS